MNTINMVTLKFKHKYLDGHVFEVVTVTVLFIVLSIFMTNGVIFNPNIQIFTKDIGDATSGFLWLTYADKGFDFMTSHSNLINFPYGESLWSPIYITWILVLGPEWLLSRIISPVAALNVMTLVGYVSAGLAAYYLLRHLVKDRLISFFGAYAIAFVPYHIMKSSDHLTNIFSWVFVAIIGTFVAFWRRPTAIRGCLLALSIAASCYTDGYFIFVSGVLILSLVIAALVTDVIVGANPKEIWTKIYKLMFVAAASIILMIPILFVQISAQQQITQDLGNSRGDIRAEISYYSAKPIDFLLPPSENITVSNFDWYKALLAKKNSRSNDAESTNYIGYTILVLYVAGLYFATRLIIDKRRKRSINEAGLNVRDHTMTIATIAAPLVLVWMLPPTIHIGSLLLKMPMTIIADFLPYWRVPARAFIALQPLMVIAATIALYKLTIRMKLRMRYLLVGILIVVVAIEYFTNVKRPSFGLDQMPRAYSWIDKQDDIRVIAELPIVDRPIEIAGYYVFAQLIHNKPMVNSALARTDIGLLNPLADQNNPETINFLRARHVDTVVIHARACLQYQWGELRYTEYNTHVPPYIDKKASATCVYHIRQSPLLDNYFVYAKTGFEKTNFLDNNGRYWVAVKQGLVTINTVDSSGKSISLQHQASLRMDIQTIGDFKKKDIAWTVLQSNVQIASGTTLKNKYITASVDVSKPIVLKITPLTGGSIAEGEIGLGAMSIEK